MNLFETFVILISLSGYLGFFTNVQKNPLKALFPLNGLIILTFYLFGVNQKLDFGYYFLILFGILSFLIKLSKPDKYNLFSIFESYFLNT